jgi:hypothetical protein
VCAGDNYIVIIDKDGSLKEATCGSAFAEVGTGHFYLQAACASDHFLALQKGETENTNEDDNVVFCKGTASTVPSNGECGDSPSVGGVTLTSTDFGGSNILMVAAGGSHSFAVDTQGNLFGWGAASVIVGDDLADVDTPTQLFVSSGGAFEKEIVARVFVASDALMVLTGSGRLYVCGDNTNDVLGLDNGGSAVSSPEELYEGGDITNVRISHIALSSDHALLLTEDTCSWFTQYRQLDYDLDNGPDYFNRTQGRRDLSACGMCAGYGQSCSYHANPLNMKTSDFGRASPSGLCYPQAAGASYELTFDQKKAVGVHHRACILDDWLLHPRRRSADGAIDSDILFRSDTWFPYPNDASLDSIPEFQEVVWPNLYARYYVTPPHKFVNLRIVVMTHDVRGLGDNVDVIAMSGTSAECHLLTLDNFEFTSIRESNPWAIDISQSDVEDAVDNSKGFCFAVYGDNQYPQKAGPSEFKLKVWWEPDFKDFNCGNDALGVDTCDGLGTNEGGDYSATTYATMEQNLVRFGKADRFLFDSENTKYGIRLNRRSNADAGSDHPEKGVKELNNGFFWNEMVYAEEGFEVNFSFKVENRFLCNGDDGFCGGGDGFVFFVHGYSGTPEASDYERDAGTAQDLGVKELENIMAIEFDTWHNRDYYDPKQGIEHWWINATEYVSYADNHIAIFAASPGTTAATMVLDHSADNLIAATPSIPNLSDGEEHVVKVWYLPDFGTHPGTITIFIDNMERPVLVGEITMIPTSVTPESAGDNADIDGTLKKWEILNPEGGAYVGFMGAQNDAPQDLYISSFNFNRFPGRVGY